MRKWPRHALLPTLTAGHYGTSNNGDPGGGRGVYAKRGKPSLFTLAKERGGKLNPQWCEWFMGFPLGWTDIADARSVMPARRHKLK